MVEVVVVERVERLVVEEVVVVVVVRMKRRDARVDEIHGCDN